MRAVRAPARLAPFVATKGVPGTTDLPGTPVLFAHAAYNTVREVAMRRLCVPTFVAIVALGVQSAHAGTLGKPLEIDPDSGAAVYVLGADQRPSDDIYGEQPYGDATGRRIAIRYYPLPEKPGGLNILDLTDGSNHEILSGKPPFPAFHAWGEWLYYAQTVGGKKLLRRCNYLTLKVENVAELPPERGSYSYGTVSPDHRYYAVSVTPPEGGPTKVHLLDLRTNQWSVLLDKPGYHAKHEQFSRDGRNRVLIQLNQMPAVKVVLLSELEIGGKEKPFPADQPFTLRPTGHEAWVGQTASIFFSTGSDKTSKGNIWIAKQGDAKPKLVYEGRRFMHVSVSRDGKYWIGDCGEKDIPIYIGSFASGRCQRACFSRTEMNRQQWSHAHPYLTADNRWLIFGSERNGHPQAHGAKLKPGWLESL
jgi:Tol biopolymer transport system component